MLVTAEGFLREVVGAVRKLASMVGHQFGVLVVKSLRSKRKFTVWKSTMNALD